MRIPRVLSGVAVLWSALFWTACVAIPLFALVMRVERLGSLMDPSILWIAAITSGQALLSAVISAAIGLPLGLWIGARRAQGRRWAELLLALPFGVPTVVAGLVWVIWLGRSGIFARWGVPLDWAYSFKAVILAHVVFNIPWIALWVAQSRLSVSLDQQEAAKTLGAGRWARFRFVLWPEVKWSFLSASCQSWMFCAMSFALVLVLGGGPPVQTLETALYSRIRFGTLDLSGAVVCAFWELVVTLLPWALVVFFQTRQGQGVRRRGRDETLPDTVWGSRLRIGASAVFFVPYLVVLGGLGSLGLEANGGEIAHSARISAELALAIAFGSVFTASMAVIAVQSIPSHRSGARMVAALLLGLPTGVSALVLGLGLWLAYGAWIDPFSGSASAMIALQIALFFPIGFRILWPVAQQARLPLLEVAATLGASPWRAFWTVEWPRWKFPLVSAWAMVAGSALGEVAAVSLFYSEDLIPLPLLISRWMAQYRFDEAQAVAGLLLILCAGTIALAYPLHALPGRARSRLRESAEER